MKQVYYPIVSICLPSKHDGLHSVNRYSAVMTQSERVIDVSEAVRRYILDNDPVVLSGRVHTFNAKALSLPDQVDHPGVVQVGAVSLEGKSQHNHFMT
jgi:hypothetical protein